MGCTRTASEPKEAAAACTIPVLVPHGKCREKNIKKNAGHWEKKQKRTEKEHSARVVVVLGAER